MSETLREVELRLAIVDSAALRARLQAAGARIIGQGLVRTSSFDFADRRLRAFRQTLRLREDWTGLTLTSKLPLTTEADEDAGHAKARDEINLTLPLEAAGPARALLSSIGLRETLRYDKERTSWQLDGARIDVDILADGGACYAEIEAEAGEIARVRGVLGLESAPVEIRSYFQIVNLARGRESDR